MPKDDQSAEQQQSVTQSLTQSRIPALSQSQLRALLRWFWLATAMLAAYSCTGGVLIGLPGVI